jgi:site-specific recombinase XerD
MPDGEVVLSERAALVVPHQGARNPALVYLASLSATGRETMAGALNKVSQLAGFEALETMPWARLKYEHVQALRAELAETYSAAYVNKILAAIRGTMHAAWQMELLDAEAYLRIKDVKAVTGSRLLAGREVTAGERQALLEACGRDRRPVGRRDGAILALAYGGGLRRAELAGLTLAGVVEEEGEIVALRLVGKRNKERRVYLDRGSAAWLRGWLRVRGDLPGPLFWRGKKGGRVSANRPLSPQAIGDIIQRRAQQAGVAHLTPHDFRRTFAGDLLDNGIDISTVAGLMGHASVSTTARYDRRGEKARRRAVQTLHVPQPQ